MDWHSVPDWFLAFWKIASPVGAGASAIFGLLNDFRNKETGKLTRAGIISIVGITLSAALGAAASAVEHQKEKEAQAEEHKKEQDAQVAQSNMLKEIMRTSSQIGEPSLLVDLLFKCSPTDELGKILLSNNGAKEICAATHAPVVPIDIGVGSHKVIQQHFHPGLVISLSVNNKGEVGNQRAALLLMADINEQKRYRIQQFFPTENGFVANMTDIPLSIGGDGTIRSWDDLPGETINILCRGWCRDVEVKRLTVFDRRSGRSLHIDGNECSRHRIDDYSVTLKCSISRNNL